MSEYFPDEKKEILITFMFRGKYAVNMIGHEIINIFKDDDGKHYIYVNPYGRVGKEHAKKIGTILLARHVSDSRIEIIAKAWGLTPSPRIAESRPKSKITEEIVKKRELHKKECENITYGGKSIEDIFEADIDWAATVAPISGIAEKLRSGKLSLYEKASLHFI